MLEALTLFTLTVVPFALWRLTGGAMDDSDWEAMPDEPDALSEEVAHIQRVYAPGLAEAGFQRLGPIRHRSPTGRCVDDSWAAPGSGLFADISGYDGTVTITSYFEDRPDAGPAAVLTLDRTMAGQPVRAWSFWNRRPQGPRPGRWVGFWCQRFLSPRVDDSAFVPRLLQCHRNFVQQFLAQRASEWRPWSNFSLAGRLEARRRFSQGFGRPDWGR
ncbi:MAG TPA: hypothetical protein VMB50_21580 [Myxococcales bacterium]|nr:hypothetical protein [Myxococcales bacterium]